MHSRAATRIGLIQTANRKYPLIGQRRICEANGALNIIELSGKQGYRLADLVLGARPEVEYVCEYLWLIAPKRGKIVARRAALTEFLFAIAERGSVLVEVGTHRWTDDAKQRSLMLAEAMVAMSTKQQPGTGRKAGRRRQGSKDDEERARTVWFDLRYKTNDDAEKAFPPGWGSISKAYRVFGSSGRIQLRKPTKKRKT
jgi:hypothetical protein